MSEKRKKPTERQKNCSYSFPYMGENFDEVYCSQNLHEKKTPDTIGSALMIS